MVNGFSLIRINFTALRGVKFASKHGQEGSQLKHNGDIDMLTRRRLLKAGTAAGAAVSAPWMWTSTNARAALALIPTAKDPRFSVPVIDPTKIDKFIDPLPVPGGP